MFSATDMRRQCGTAKGSSASHAIEILDQSDHDTTNGIKAADNEV